MVGELPRQYTLPIYFDLGATFLYALSGALVAIRRRYDIVGLFVLALVSGVGGGLIRDGIFIQDGPPLAMKDERYLYAIFAGCLVAALFTKRMDRLQKVFLMVDALGLGAYAVVGVEKSLNAGLSTVAAIMVGVINAAGGGLLRDVLVREEPLLFKPGQLYVFAALLGAGLFTILIIRFHWPVESAALLAAGSTFVFRLLAITFNWKTMPVAAGTFVPSPLTVAVSMPDQPSVVSTESTSYPLSGLNPMPSAPPPAASPDDNQSMNRQKKLPTHE
jgi:uncharacterized membrane protein YeiH